jgi:hypothetical protein
MVLGEDIVEAALWNTHVKWHLAAFKSVDRNTRTAGLTLLAATRGLALARTNTTANAHTAMAGAFVVFNVIQFHVVHSLSL